MRMKVIALVFLCMLLTACAAHSDSAVEDSPTWQEQYDLGLRYMEEGNYEEAILSFTAAIEIDPKQAPAYIGRGDAYVRSGETEENLAAALSDYEKAIALDETAEAAYLGIADVYIRQGEYDKALEILRQGLGKIKGNTNIENKIAEMEQGNFIDSSGKILRESVYSPEGELMYVYDFTYDSKGFEISFYCTSYLVGEEDYYANVEEFDRNGYPYRRNYYHANGQLIETYDLMTFNDMGQETERYKYSGENFWLYRFYYDEQGKEIKFETYENGETLTEYGVSTYDQEGNLLEQKIYEADGTLVDTHIYN